jgi:hypothetical protein
LINIVFEKFKMKSLVIVILSFLCLGLSAQDKNLNTSGWHASDKIKETDFKSLKNTDIQYIISNNKDFVYLVLKIPKQETIKTIQDDGLTIWIDMDEKKSTKMGIKYAIQTEKEAPFKQTGTIELIGFITEQERHFPAENADNFRASLLMRENGLMFVKIVMPLEKLPLRNSRNGGGAMPFSIGVEPGTAKVFWISHIKLATSG